MVHFYCIVTLSKSDRKEGKNLAFNGKEYHFTFFFAILWNTFEESCEHQTCPQKVTEVFKTYHEIR